MITVRIRQEEGNPDKITKIIYTNKCQHSRKTKYKFIFHKCCPALQISSKKYITKKSKMTFSGETETVKIITRNYWKKFSTWNYIEDSPGWI